MTERRDIWKAHEDDGLWNETVLAYALAFGELARPKPNRPASWDLTYQAAVHDMNPLPPRGDLRAQCQHDTWFFLPWHRMYLLHFEAVIRAIILDLPAGPISDETRDSWALPYWDYGPAANRLLPPAFREAALPDGTPNPLARANRFRAVQQGTVGLTDAEVEFAGWWNQPVFTLPSTPSFGGSDTAGPRHRPLDFRSAGALEVTPHGTVHVYVGPDMRDFTRAGFDPIFWLHHCNLDRLWEVWRTAGPVVRTNPTTGGWLTERFSFLDVEGNVWSGTSADVDSTTALGYTYENTSAPTAAQSPTPTRTSGGQMPDDETWREALAPRALGSADQEIELGSEARTVGVDLASDRQMFARVDRPAPARIILDVNNIGLAPASLRRIEAGTGLIGTYAVYLEGTRTGVEAFVGNLPLFGLIESLREDGHQLGYTFDITDAVGTLSAQDAWEWEHADIRVQPNNPDLYADEAEIVTVTVGNFTISYQ